MRKKIVLWGASNHATVIADIIRLQGVYDLAGFLDDVNPERAGEQFCGAVVLGGRDQLKPMRAQAVTHMMMAFGDNRARLRLAAIAREHGYQLATAAHPNAVIASDAAIGAGTAIMAGAIINPGAKVGENTIINTGAIVEHGSIIGDGALVNARALVAGNVIIGTCATVEIGAIVAANVKIGADSVVGAGSLVLKDIPEKTLAYGNPATVIKKRGAS